MNKGYCQLFDVIVTDVLVTVEPKEIMADVNAMFYNG